MDNYLSYIVNKNPDNKIFTGIILSLNPLQVLIYPADEPINCKGTTGLVGLKIGSNVIILKIGSQFIITHVIGTPNDLYSCLLRRNSKSIPHATLTSIDFGSGSTLHDPMTMHIEDESKITIKKAGYYNVLVSGRFNDSSTAGRILYLYKNGVAYSGLSASHDGSGRFGGSFNSTLQLTVNDYLDFIGYQESGSTLGLTAIEFNVVQLF
jgi:hypothetical protein